MHTGLLRRFVDPATYGRLLFVVTAVPLGAIGAVVLIAGWALVAALAITPAVVPALIAFRAVVGLLARAEASLASGLLGASTRPGRWRSGGSGFWRRGRAVLEDGAFWREQAYLALRFPLGLASAVLELSLIAGGLFLTGLPIYYRWVTTGSQPWQANTLEKALLCVPVGLIGLIVAVALVAPLAAAWRGVAEGLLRGEAVAMPQQLRKRALAVHAAAVAALGALLIVIWALASWGGYFWPVWPILVGCLPLAIHAWVEQVLDRPGLLRRKALAIHAGVYGAFILFFVGVWAFSGHGYFWPVWAALGLGLPLAGHTAVSFARGRDGLAERIDILETTRAGAVDVQETELRRIERDLHDGAQARLVALGMNLGMAEQKFVNDPVAARELVAEARVGVEAALRELRDLARGIHPPVLTDRGLGPAIEALADHSPLPVDVTVDLGPRPAPAVETAAYFVAAEGLTNATKHARASRITIRIARERDRLVLEIADDGAGGADPAGGGLSGLRRRVEALDGRLTITSPSGGPTVLRADLPCAS